MNPRILLLLALAGLGVWAALSWLSPPSSEGDVDTEPVERPRVEQGQPPQPPERQPVAAMGDPEVDPPEEPEPVSEPLPEVPPVATATMPALELSEVVTSSDGSRALKTWANPRVLVQFDVHKGRRVRPVDGAEPMETGVTTWLWLLPEGRSSTEVAAELNAKEGGGKYSPLLHDGPSSASPRRAPGGGVIVQFQDTWDAERVDAWADAEGFRDRQALTIGPGWYVFGTEPGTAAIERAAALEGRDGIVTVAPNWWRPRAWK